MSDPEVALLERGWSGVTTPSSAAIARERIEALDRALAKLPEEQRRVVLLHKLVGLPHAEVARELEKSEVAVRSLLHRALARLAIELGDGPAGL